MSPPMTLAPHAVRFYQRRPAPHERVEDDQVTQIVALKIRAIRRQAIVADAVKEGGGQFRFGGQQDDGAEQSARPPRPPLVQGIDGTIILALAHLVLGEFGDDILNVRIANEFGHRPPAKR